MLLADAIGGFAAAAKETKVDQETIDGIVSALVEFESQLEMAGVSFGNAELSRGLGSSGSAAALGQAHNRARDVMVETVVEMTRQLRGYGDNLRDFARVVAATDEQAGADMRLRQQAAERLAEGIAAQTPALPSTPAATPGPAGPGAPAAPEGGEGQ